ncbi:hypothetical protein BDV95DRAFT_546738 [Massariosphaeria phaeospora]|uniref:LicD family-domain-containing protein n=1 Tax=Massariosphaeria phaeospora TaxID=100035 RepID=A0A7C8MCA9_9PLEO|nr:hypothetical protein BDV95DRAFT_546738 [Massariosphaeria phaeospora]
MRHVLATILGLIALGGVQARALQGANDALDERAPKVDFTHISDYPLDDPRNDGLAERSPKVDFTHISDYPLDDPRNDGLAKRVTPNPRPAKPPAGYRPASGTKPRPGRPNGNEEPEGPSMAIERGALYDSSDIKRVTPCGNAKRGLEELEFNSQLDKRMSGQEKALTYPEWIQGDLERDFGLVSKYKMIFVGGITGIAFGSRGPDGKTGDIDYSIPPDQGPEFLQAMNEAVTRMVAKNPGKFEIIPQINKEDPFNNRWDEHADPSAREALSVNSHLVAWEGHHFTAFHGDWRMQLMGKMIRIAEFRARGQEYKERDQQDAQFFLAQTRQQQGIRNRDLTMNDFAEWGAMQGKSVEEIGSVVTLSARLVTDQTMTGLDQAIRDRVNRARC